MARVQVAYFPYSPGANPYQRLFSQALEKADVSVQRIPPRKLLPLRHVASRRADLVQLDWPHDWYQGRNAWTRALKQVMFRDGLRQLRKVPVVWTAHNLQAHDASDAAFERHMIQALIDVCDGIIVMSQASEVLLQQSYSVSPATRVEVIPHGHYIGCYPNEIDRTEARRRLGLQDARRIVLSLGRLQPYKGLEDLIAAFSKVAEEGDVLLLAGKAVNDGYGGALENLARVHGRPGIAISIRDGLVPDDQLQCFFNACDVVALPFRQVLNSGSLLLAMSFGCQVIAPRLGSIPEVACPQGWFAYDAAEPDGLCAALGVCFAESARGATRAEVMDFTARRFAWGTVGERACDLYCAILGRAVRGSTAGSAESL